MRAGIRCRIYGSMSIVDGVVTAYQEPVDVHTMTSTEIAEEHALFSEERRRARIAKARASKELQYQRKRLP